MGLCGKGNGIGLRVGQEERWWPSGEREKYRRNGSDPGVRTKQGGKGVLLRKEWNRRKGVSGGVRLVQGTGTELMLRRE